jgi:hypothetical protein
VPKKQRVWKPLLNQLNPLQKQLKTNCKPMGHNPRVDLCPKLIKKMKKNEGFRRNGVSGKMGKIIKWAAGGG